MKNRSVRSFSDSLYSKGLKNDQSNHTPDIFSDKK